MAANASKGDPQEPSLELPSLFKRRRKTAAPPTERPAALAEDTPAPAPPDEAPDVLTASEPIATEHPMASDDSAVVVTEPEPEPVTAVDEPAMVVSAPVTPEPATPELATPPPITQPPQPPVATEPREFKLPRVAAWLATLLTGLLVGLLGTGLTYAGLKGCESARGTDSCGGPGAVILLAIVVLMAIVGALLLAAWDLPDARGTSLLAVGIMCVVVILGLLEELFDAWMFLVVPLLGAAAYFLAYRVTTAFVEVDSGPTPTHDIR